METPPPQPADVSGPHHDAAIYRAGLDPAAADVTLVLVHGRGARAGGMVQFALQQVETPVAMVAPEAVGWEWYPESFLAPREANEPSLTSAIAVVDAAIDMAQAAGAAPTSIVCVGFSQGACLVAETVLRRDERLGGAVMLSGGLIGAPDRSFRTDAELAGMPAFVGVSDDDPHIPLERAAETAEVFEAAGAAVRFDTYEGVGHTIVDEEVAYLNALVDETAAGDA
jgi:phospholipase/carboxylesterase